MKMVNIYEAKTNFSKLLEQLQAGEQIVIAKNGKPIADLTLRKSDEQSSVRLGAWADNPNVIIPDDFDDPDPKILEMFEGGSIFTNGEV